MPTYKLIASSTVGSGGASSITFSSIPQTYTDLKVVFSTRASGAITGVGLSFNGVTTNLSSKILYNGPGSDVDTARIWMYGDPGNYTANTFANSEAYIPNYTGSTAKSVSSDSSGENNAAGAALMISAGLWNSTSAITSVTLTPFASDTFVQYSTAYLYGISNA